MKFLIDRCAGRRLAEWLRQQGHDVSESRELGPDPGDQALLGIAAAEERIFITMDKDFGEFIFLRGASHHGLIRLPDVPSEERVLLLEEILRNHGQALAERAIITVRGGRIRISHPFI